MKLPATTKRNRACALLVLLALQTALFFFFLRGHPEVVSDNERYETAGWSIASGHGLALPYKMSPDPIVHEWVCSRHPEACTDGTYPSAQYPPGYQFFIAGLYLLFGRSLWAIVIAQLGLLWIMLACFERLAAKYLQPAGYWFVVLVAGTYPFIVRQSTLIMSDHLHATLLLGALTAIMTMKPGWPRILLFGGLFGLATFTRPYCVVCLPFVFGWPRLRRAFAATQKQWLGAVFICILPFILWTARNAYWFGRFIPFSTVGIGVHLYTNKMEAQWGEVYDPEAYRKAQEAIYRNGEDPANYGLNKELGQEALVWMRDNPGTMLKLVITRIPRLWISKGYMSHGISPLYPVSIAYLGGLLVLGVVGMWFRRREDVWKLPAVVILTYWAFLLNGTAEARRTLPLRLPMLVFAGYTVEVCLRRLQVARKRFTDEEEPTISPAIGPNHPAQESDSTHA